MYTDIPLQNIMHCAVVVPIIKDVKEHLPGTLSGNLFLLALSGIRPPLDSLELGGLVTRLRLFKEFSFKKGIKYDNKMAVILREICFP